MNKVDKLYIDTIEDVYKNYENNWLKENPPFAGPYADACLTQEQFVNKIKTDGEFCKMMNITFEKRELSEKERIGILHSKHGNKGHHMEAGFNMLDEFDIPTKLIKITYNGETREIYE